MGKRGFRSRVTGELVSRTETLTHEELAITDPSSVRNLFSTPLTTITLSPECPDWSNITVPFFSAGNWGGQGLHLRGNVEGFVRAASKHKWLEIHGIEHWTHFYTDYGRLLQKRFLDYFLKGTDNGWQHQPLCAASGAPRR